jgi:hypothetical protein
MASQITLQTTDNQLTITNNFLTANGNQTYWDIKFKLNNNYKKANTIGNLIKVQKGRDRVDADLMMVVDEDDIDELLALINYQTPIDITLSDRNILGRQKNTGRFAITDFDINQEFDQGAQIEVTIKLVEVLAQ